MIAGLTFGVVKKGRVEETEIHKKIEKKIEKKRHREGREDSGRYTGPSPLFSVGVSIIFKVGIVRNPLEYQREEVAPAPSRGVNAKSHPSQIRFVKELLCDDYANAFVSRNGPLEARSVAREDLKILRLMQKCDR
ncbi:hypothetical protein HZH66_004587 [Vespula vulgaris]|uniref:Uncharacterized protein n=1 Tax=Vespula vulgaris TaxID=7454 RepID=A0A834NAZ3_VESVU|nr:hypothetical protein HZH66_004587 [Vespula vulgaris]